MAEPATPTQPQTILIERARYVLTMDARNTILEQASLVIRGDRIVDLGPAAEVAARHPRHTVGKVLDAGHHLVLPGFIDTHMHLTEHLSRGIIPDHLSTVEWVYDWAKPVYSAPTDEDEYVSSLLACVEMIKTGTTCFIDQGVYNPGVRSGEAIEQVGIRGIVGRHAADKPPEKIPAHWDPAWVNKQYSTTEEALRELERVIRLWNGRANGRIRAWANLEGKVHHTTDELYVGAKKLADQYGVGTAY
ncbi:MAG: amidohydrolase family protein, partial [Deltaproteobacteria bacterium]|nr:amidohydrolase family protein [Deltaproteobacteria bacterium]